MAGAVTPREQAALEVPSALPGLLAAALPWRSASEHSRLMSRLDHVAAIIQRAIAETARIHLAAGAREVYGLFTRPVRIDAGGDFAAFEQEVLSRGTAPNRIALFTAHQMGTARMGADARAGVADPDGAVRGVRGLWVADASAFPTASGVNPTLTIMALAMRNARRMLAAAAR